MKSARMVGVALLLLAVACGGGSNERTLLVDYSSDEFASFLLANFPSKVDVHQGDTLVVRQTFTGEPHTFTGGTTATKYIEQISPWIDVFDAFGELQGAGVPLPNPEDPGDATVASFAKTLKESKPSAGRTKLINALKTLRARDPRVPDLDNPPAQSFKDFAAFVEKESDPKTDLPDVFDERGDGGLTQNGSQPCYLATGVPPRDPTKGCSKAQQKQPSFNGNQSFYSSGIIPYEGQQGNTYRVQLADDIAPGSYVFFCLVHGPQQQTNVVVKPKDAKIPGQDAVDREARKEINVMIEPLRKQFSEASKTGKLTIPGEEKTTVSGPFAGLIGGDHTAVNEFVPKKITAKVGQPITWKMMGSDHTISFNVPKYFPPVEFLKDGTVRFNPKLRPPAGGAKKVPEQDGMGVVKFDGGTFNGKGLWSSGLIGAEPYLEYTMRISAPGTYRVACLIHPPMVGTVVVTQ
jgi:plastocyanin